MKSQYDFNKEIEEEIIARFSQLESIFLHNTHECNCLLPPSWSYLIANHPNFLTTFGQNYLKSSEVEKQQADKALKTLSTDQWINYTVSLPRLLFIHLLVNTVDSSSSSQTSQISLYQSSSIKER